jgi:hypothetical protein
VVSVALDTRAIEFAEAYVATVEESIGEIGRPQAATRVLRP